MRGHLGKFARALYSNPPAFGARVVDAVLADACARGAVARVPRGHVGAHRGHAGEAAERARGEDARATGLCTAWDIVCSTAWRHAIDATVSARWRDGRRPRRSHITSQVGMFSYTGLTAPQVLRLRAEQVTLHARVGPPLHGRRHVEKRGAARRGDRGRAPGARWLSRRRRRRRGRPFCSTRLAA